MQKLKTEKGITLIALIITIIVMLILVGVSVTVALNGGLFTTAKDATNKTQLEIDKEQLLELALGAMNDNGKVVIGDLDTAVAADGKFTGTGGTYTSVKSGNTFTVSQWGSVTVAPEYKLSGKWIFIDNPTPQQGESAGTIVSQDISFTSLGWVEAEEEGGNIGLYLGNVSYSSIVIKHDDYNGMGTDFVLAIDYDNTNVYYLATDGWGMLEGNYNTQIVDFGSEPQTVSQEFYEWFTANANPVE